MGLLPLDEVRRAVTGPWAVGRAQFWWRAAESAASNRDWSTACTRLLNLVDPLDSVPSGGAAWRQLAVAALDAAVRAKDTELVAAAAMQLAGRAWSPADELSDLLQVFRAAEQIPAAREGAALGSFLRQRYPASAWAHYAAAHFAELSAIVHDEPLRAPDRVVDSFGRAAELFEVGGSREHAVHARLRAAVAQVAYTPHHAEGRRNLSEIAGHVSGDDAFWLAYGRAHSAFWLDRVRATDWVADVLDADSRLPDVERTRATNLAARIVRSLGVRLSDAEQDRLRAVSSAFPAEQRWELEAQLRGRSAAEPHLGTPVADFDVGVAQQVEEAALSLDGFAELVAAWRGLEGAGRPKSRVTAAVVDFLRAPDDATAAALCAAAGATVDPAELRPVFLALAQACRVERRDELRGPITELALYYAQRGPTPSAGFTALGAALFEAGFQRAAAVVTRRAVEEGEQDARLRLCIARSVQWAVREAGEGELLGWLELGEAHLTN